MTLMRQAWLSLLLMALWHPGMAMEVNEARIKTGFLYNFAKHTTWPGPATHRLLCVVEGHMPERYLLELEGLPLGQHALHTRSITQLSDARNCHVLFIGRNQRARLGEWLDAVDGLPVLTITDIGRMGHPKSAINLYTERRRLRFDINLAPARNGGLTLSSRLTELADTVYGWE